MSQRPIVRGGLLAYTMLFLFGLAWQALAGGFRQLSRSRTVGQKAETMIQIECGLMSLLVMLTCFWKRRWAQPVHTIWSIALAATAGLSSLVWGPPMPQVGLLFSAAALLVSQAIRWALGTALVD